MGRYGKFRPRSFFCSLRNVVKRDAAENAGMLCCSHWMQHQRKAQLWTAATFRRSLRNAPSDAARRETLGCSVARSRMIRRRKTGERDNGLECWEEACRYCGVWGVALVSSSRVWQNIPVLTQRHSVVSFGASVQKGRGMKHCDASQLAASGGLRF